MHRATVVMKVFGILIVAAGCVFVSVATASEGVSLDDLGWLAGFWVGSAGETTMEEIWTPPAGGVMLGLHRDMTPGRPAFFEYLRIEQKGSEVVYVASPRGGAATEFTLISAGATEVEFENPGHDFPQRIIYRRQGNLLIARVEGEISGRTEGQEWQWQLSTPGWVAGSTPE